MAILKTKHAGNHHVMKSSNSKTPAPESHPSRARPLVTQTAPELQMFGAIVKLPIGLEEQVCMESVTHLNQILADTMTLRDLYKKHHWQVVGPTFYQTHVLFDKHDEEQVKLVDEIAERIQLSGGLSLAMAPDVAEETQIPRPPHERCSSRSTRRSARIRCGASAPGGWDASSCRKRLGSCVKGSGEVNAGPGANNTPHPPSWVITKSW